MHDFFTTLELYDSATQRYVFKGKNSKGGGGPGLDWDKLMAMEHPVPFAVDLEYEKPTRQSGAPTPEKCATGGGTQLDYFCQMVDYMKTSMSMRTTWPLKAEDQNVFQHFDFVSNKVFEEELLAMTASAGSAPF